MMNDVYAGNQGAAGSFSFSGQYTGSERQLRQRIRRLPARPAAAVQQGVPFNFHLRNSLFAGFVQDNYQATPNLTLNLGLRYEVTTPRGDKNPSNNVNFDLVTGTPEIGTNYNTYTGIDNFQPRVGFAWQPTGRRTRSFAAHTTFPAIWKATASTTWPSSILPTRAPQRSQQLGRSDCSIPQHAGPGLRALLSGLHADAADGVRSGLLRQRPGARHRSEPAAGRGSAVEPDRSASVQGNTTSPLGYVGNKTTTCPTSTCTTRSCSTRREHGRSWTLTCSRS